MAKYYGDLDLTFSALSDPTRRGVLEQLSRGQSRVTDLASPYDMALPSFSKHLRVLENAGLVIRDRRGREHRIRIDPGPIQRAQDWLALYADHWRRQFDALDAYLSRAKREMPGSDTDGGKNS